MDRGGDEMFRGRKKDGEQDAGANRRSSKALVREEREAESTPGHSERKFSSSLDREPRRAFVCFKGAQVILKTHLLSGSVCWWLCSACSFCCSRPREVRTTGLVLQRQKL